jgi:hypothetical protein
MKARPEIRPIIAELSFKKIADMEPEAQFKYLLAEVKNAAGLRAQAQECARDAAHGVGGERAA